MKQSDGDVCVTSEPGAGTTFRIYLPQVQEAATEPRTLEQSRVLTGTETVLVVEDQDEVRRVARRILSRYGYQVLEARNAGDAVLACEQYEHPIDLLLTDVVMPVVGGRQLADRLTRIRPQMKVLYMSGYSEHTMVRQGNLEPDVEYVQKPLVPATLARRVREVLDAAQSR